MNKIAVIVFALGLIGWGSAQASKVDPETDYGRAVYEYLGINPESGLDIIEPDFFSSTSPTGAPNPANYAWMVIGGPGGGGVSFKLAAFSYGDGVPDTGRIICRYQGANWGSDHIFTNGFEEGIPLIGGGVIATNWWIPVSGFTNSYNTSRVFGATTAAGWHRCSVLYQVTGVRTNTAQYTFEVEQ